MSASSFGKTNCTRLQLLSCHFLLARFFASETGIVLTFFLIWIIAENKEGSKEA